MQRIILATVCVLVAGGCTSKSDEREQLAGEVTFAGRPVPGGVILFEPDVSKGQDGRQGVAKIVEGRFDTRDGGKGVSGGHYIAKLSGFEVDAAANGERRIPLFDEYRVEIEITPDTREIDFDVPADAGKDVAPLPNLAI